MRTLVIGLGNPILGDDSIGWRVVQEVERLLDGSRGSVEIDTLSRGGLALMERMEGYDRAILVDALLCAGNTPGRVCRLTPDELPSVYANSAHDASFNAALALGRSLGARLPDEIVIVGIEIQPRFEFTEQLSAPIAASLHPAAEAVLAELKQAT